MKHRGGNVRKQCDEYDVDRSLVEVTVQVARRSFDEADLHIGSSSDEVRDSLVQRSRYNPGIKSDREGPRSALGDCYGAAHLLVDCIEEGACRRQNGSTDRRQRNRRTAPPFEKVAAEQLLESGNGLAYGGLTHPQPPRRVSETASFGNCEEGFELVEVGTRSAAARISHRRFRVSYRSKGRPSMNARLQSLRPGTRAFWCLAKISAATIAAEPTPPAKAVMAAGDGLLRRMSP